MCGQKNLKTCDQIIRNEVKKLDHLKEKELREAKEHLIGKMLVKEEDTMKVAEEMAFWEQVDDVKGIEESKRKIKAVTKKDILRVRDRYFKNYMTSLLGDV